MANRLDEVTETMARRLSQRFSRRSFFARAAGATLVIGGGEAGVLAFRAEPALAAFSAFCGGVCFGSCPGGTIGGGCWWGCDTAACNKGCCGGRLMKLCDCCCTSGCCGVGNPCIYNGAGTCVNCRRVVECDINIQCC